ncbi:hypothetical protein GRJ2_000478100 [Grus japonensis]|uniref:Secreted protein n=1 Tax=Grus japonensis TaxID=30415 RepID=A0ABC9W4R7_GRUJA
MYMKGKQVIWSFIFTFFFQSCSHKCGEGTVEKEQQYFSVQDKNTKIRQRNLAQVQIDLGLEEAGWEERGEACSQQQRTKGSILLLTPRRI